MAKKKKKKSGSIAVPYLLTVFIGILIIGGGTYFFLRYLGILGGSHELPPPPQRDIVTSSYADNHTILFILDEPEKKCNTTFMLLRSIPKDKKLVFVGVPTNMIAIVNDKQQSLQNVYDTGGAAAAVEFTQSVFDVPVDRYMRLDHDTLIKICDILGGVNYPISEEIAGFNGDGSEKYLNSEQIETLITYSFFNDGEMERAYIVGSVFSSMVNQTSGTRISDNLDSTFNTIVNMCDTNITAVDYKKHKVAIKNMLENGQTIGSFMIINGNMSYDDFIPDESFFTEFKTKYYSYDEQKDSSDDQETGE